MNPNYNRFLRRRHPSRRTLESESLSDGFSDSSDQVLLESRSLPRDRINHRDFTRRFNESQPSAQSMQQLVLNFFLANNLKEEALIFAKEASLNIENLKETRFLDCKKIVDQLFSKDEFDLLAEKIHEVDSKILANNKTLLFDLKSLKFNSLNKESLTDVHTYVRHELLQIIEQTNDPNQKSKMLSQCEAMIGSFYLKSSLEIPRDQIRRTLINEIAASLGLSGHSKLDDIIRVLFNVQSLLLESFELPLLSQELVYKISEFVE